MIIMSSNKRPYWLWDYDLTEKDVRRILNGKNEIERRWLIGRILESAKYDDVWKYLTLKQVRENFPALKLKPPIKRVWQMALNSWS
ncbi:MAG: hypothetical protein U0946_04145 [Patescibacteria group bacterium]|nr:hypothetical protein [Patescibacteria group bacterium]